MHVLYTSGGKEHKLDISLSDLQKAVEGSKKYLADTISLITYVKNVVNSNGVMIDSIISYTDSSKHTHSLNQEICNKILENQLSIKNIALESPSNLEDTKKVVRKSVAKDLMLLFSQGKTKKECVALGYKYPTVWYQHKKFLKKTNKI